MHILKIRKHYYTSYTVSPTPTACNHNILQGPQYSLRESIVESSSTTCQTKTWTSCHSLRSTLCSHGKIKARPYFWHAFTQLRLLAKSQRTSKYYLAHCFRYCIWISYISSLMVTRSFFCTQPFRMTNIQFSWSFWVWNCFSREKKRRRRN